jgi:TolA-binding protein
VMEALDQKQKHIPFRNSKLTYLLQNALGGNAKTVMIFTVCPTDLTSDETLFTLQFAQRVRNITLTTAHRNISAKNLEISVKVLKSELREVKKKKIALEELLVETKKDAKKALEKANGPMESKIKALEDFKRTQETSVATLTKQIHDLNGKIDEEKNAKQQSLFDLELTQRNLKRALEISKEYTSENDRLNTLVKTKDKELTSLKEAVAKTIISAQQQQQSFGNQQTPQSEGSASRRNSFSAVANSSQKNITIPELSPPEQQNMKRRNSDGDLHVSFTSPLSPSSPTNTKNNFTTFFAEKKIPTPQISPINRNSINHVVSPKVVTPPSQNEPHAGRNNSINVPTQQQLMESNSFDEEKSVMEEHSNHHISMIAMNTTYASPERNMNNIGGM